MLANYFADVELIKFTISTIDIVLVWILVYTALNLLKGTRGIQLLKGILIVLVLKVAFNTIGLTTMSYIVDQLVTWGVLAIIIIFQPEIRRTLEHIGRFDFLNILFKNQNETQKEKFKIINILANSTKYMSRRRIGALIVLENFTGLEEYTEAGIKLNSDISEELVINIFVPNTPLHDGALVLNQEKLLAASCVLPLSDSRNIDNKYGTRHRAALGLSEVTDSLIIVVSEETGEISIATNGKLVTKLDEISLKNFLSKNWLVNKNKLGGIRNE